MVTLKKNKMFFVKHSKFKKGNMGIWCLQNRYKIYFILLKTERISVD